MSFEHDKRIIVYPNYINSKRTVAEGRRIPASKAAENPMVNEMFDCCKYLKVPAEVEDKAYPRDWLIRGRLRVQLRNEDGTPVNPEIPDRRTLLLKIAELVPKHPGRHKKPGQQTASAKQEATSSSSSAAGSSAAASSKASNNKSSKKKKK